ncbi:putative membrane protein YphA (DoxX/SURF4 family) [Dysgonomonadaceae bacterium PH5-43]|nr:putative membrane protein YphA (DoxX/SURF4 family) [Dysgonomonadaceae bacterium PH5-43]
MANKLNIPVKIKRIVVELLRVSIGLLFLFSGFVKAVDLWGSAYKFQDYFTAFGLDFFDFLSLPASFFLSAFEFSLGLCLLAGVYRKVTSFIIVLFMGFMTCLTFYLAIANPVSDCGCFGDAFVISNWATFAKNIIILPASILMFAWRKEMRFLFSKKSRSLVSLYSWVFILGVSVCSFLYLPIFDFRPYKIGVNIEEQMSIPEGAEMDEFETYFIYEKNGEKQRFTIDNYPKEGSGWEFVDSETTLIKKGYEPPIYDFSVADADGFDITDNILANEDYTFLLISHKLEKASDSNIDKINEVYDYAKQNGYDFYCLTSSGYPQIEEWKESTGAEYTFCTMDDIALKTIIRSNPGLMLIKGATILNKWSDKDIPEVMFESKLEESIYGQVKESNNRNKIIFLGLILVLPLAVLSFADWNARRMDRKKNTNKL